METRKCKISVGKPGGNASKNAKNYRLSIPTKRVQGMGVSPEERELLISFDGECITIKKAKSEEST